DYAARTGLISRSGTKSATVDADITGADQLRIVVSNCGDGFAYDRADIVNPVLVDAEGNETKLTTLKPTSYTSEWGTLHTNANVEGGPLKIEGKTYSNGLGANAQCTIIYDLPQGHNFVRLKALCGYDSSCDTDNTSSSGTTMEFIIYADRSNDDFAFDLTLLGYGAGESVPVYDVWSGESLGTFTGTINTTVRSHGARLLRIGNEIPAGIRLPQTSASTAGKTTADDGWYNLQGVKTDSPKSGIYIRNGKKIIK
ncbi:MAG: NPCBM/NEW2 domain-containing protein, partial [Prevotella sp.]|nr:NPCBM/NEW2 domain-containing protein [Prevotella sp.]